MGKTLDNSMMSLDHKIISQMLSELKVRWKLRISLSQNFSVAQALPTQELAEWRRIYLAGNQRNA